MSDKSKIEWTESTWNPILGCDRVSSGCANCYAVNSVWRMAGNPNPKIAEANAGLVVRRENGNLDWTGKVRCLPERLDQPLRWKKPRRIFVNSQSDLFHEDVPNEFLDRMFAVMALCPHHTFQVLTKRPERMREYILTPYRWMNVRTAVEKVWTDFAAPALVSRLGEWVEREIPALRERFQWPLPNVWLGVSVEDQQTVNERILPLLQTPAAIRWVSYEPALGPVDFGEGLFCDQCRDTPHWGAGAIDDPLSSACGGRPWRECGCSDLHWIVVGGESGPHARPFRLEWARGTIRQCREAGVPVFVKQLGSRPVEIAPELPDWPSALWVADEPGFGRAILFDPKGGDPAEWPEDLRVREWPDAD